MQGVGESSQKLDEDNFPPLMKTCKGADHSVLTSLPTYHASKVTEIIEIPVEQRKLLLDESDGANKRQTKICLEIARETGVQITLTNSKSNLLTVVVSGQPSKVAKAKRSIISELQQQESAKITVPVEFHGYIIGRRGDRLRELEATTMTRINVPSSNSVEPNKVTITGPKQGIIDAETMIKDLITKQAEQGFERLDIPKVLHQFVFGPSNRFINEIQEKTGTKISIPPPSAPGTIVTISGKRAGVAEAARQLTELHEEAQQAKTIPVNVKKSQHRLVFGQRASGLAEIRDETGVCVEMPTDPNSEDIILRGRPENLGRALSMVYVRAESKVIDEIPAAHRFFKYMIGRESSALNELLEGYSKVNVEFDSSHDKIVVEGPPEQVVVIMDRLQTRLRQLESTVAQDTIRVNPKYFRHIIGRQGCNIGRLRELGVQVTIPKAAVAGGGGANNVGNARATATEPDEIIIEGDPAGVEKAKSEIQSIVERLENEKSKDMIIEPRIQQLLMAGRNGVPPPIRTIYENFPKVTVVWPNEGGNQQPHIENPTRSVVQLRGDRQQVDAAAERLVKLIKLVTEENQRQEIRIFKEFRPHIFGRGSIKIQKLLDDTKTRMQYPDASESSDVFTIIGREENVRQAIQQLEDLQKKMANVKDVIVSIPSSLTTKFIVNSTQSTQPPPTLRSIREQCHGVHLRLVNPQQARPQQRVDVIVMGPAEEVEKAQRLVDELNAKVAQLCAEELVHVDPKFHGFLIGRQGANITRFRESHNVELLFPDRNETDANLASEIRIVGTKETVVSAKTDLLAMIKSIEDEVEESFEVDADLLKDITHYRRAFFSADLDSVRVLMPRVFDRSIAGDDDTDTAAPVNRSTAKIRLVGQKACVQAAIQALTSIVDEIRSRVNKEFPLADRGSLVVLDRMRSQFPELERHYHVFIRLSRPAPGDPAMEEANGAQPKQGVLSVTGPADNVERLYNEKIKPALPVVEEFAMPQEFHRNLILAPNTTTQPERRRGGPLRRGAQKPDNEQQTSSVAMDHNNQSKANELKQKYGVFIRLPLQGSTGTNVVYLHGTQDQLSAAKPDLLEWLSHCEELKKDRIARSYELSVPVPTRFMQSLLALRLKITSTHDIGMRFISDHPVVVATPSSTVVEGLTNGCSSVVNPQEGDPHDDFEKTTSAANGDDDTAATTTTTVVVEPQTTVVFRGYKERVELAREELLAEVARLAEQVTENLCIPAQVHAQLIGARGYAIQKLMQEHKVRVEFPSRNSARYPGMDANTVLVSGLPDDVDRACDYLIGRANDLMERAEPRQQLREELFPAVQPPSDILKV